MDLEAGTTRRRRRPIFSRMLSEKTLRPGEALRSSPRTRERSSRNSQGISLAKSSEANQDISITLSQLIPGTTQRHFKENRSRGQFILDSLLEIESQSQCLKDTYYRGDIEMDFQRWGTGISLLICCLMTIAYAGGDETSPVWVQAATGTQVQRITAEELKARLSRNEALTILDVRDTDSYVNSNNRIKSSIHVKLRRLESRLTLPPLRNVPRDREVVTYCAGPHDEASLRDDQIRIDAGFKRVRVLEGGWQAWLKTNGQVESRPKA